MSDIHCIRTLRNQKDLSISTIAKTLDINWRTAKKYADESIEEKSIIKPKTGMMYKEKWGLMVSDWLLEDRRETAKKRRNKTQIFEELKRFGFKGSYRTVCNFINEWKGQNKEISKDQGTERLEHPNADGQLDFGVMEAVEGGEVRDIHLLILSFPASNTAFYEPLPSENQECLLEGIKTLFQKAEGVPKNLRIDNMTPAVKKTRSKTEEATLTDEFMRFQCHYGFHSQVCNAGKGNEKGHVEGKVKYVRYQIFSVPPVIKDLTDLSEQLDAFTNRDLQRDHYEKKVPIKELWELEKNTLLHFPEEPYQVKKEVMVKANSYNEIKVDQARIHVPRAKNHVQLYLVLTWSEFQVVSPDGDILCQGYRPYMNKRNPLPWKSVLRDWLDKPRMIEYSRYERYLPTRIKDYLVIPSHGLRVDRIEQLIKLLSTYSMQEINERFYELTMETAGDGCRQEDPNHPYGVNWSDYDQLTQPESIT